MSDRADQPDLREDGQPEPAVEGGTGPGVTPGEVETPGAATTPNAPDDDDGDAEPGAN
jgi:hypothetical protein